MKTLVVTSQVTFVPENYDRLIVGLAAVPQVGGLLVLNNWDYSLCFKALGLTLAGAPRTGTQLIKNRFGSSQSMREYAYTTYKKPIWTLDTINCQEALDIVVSNGFDLIVNARTRFIYKKPILNAPPMGCINIHHGLLPDQRGTMCDLWSLYAGKPAGFSLHRMSEKIDDGEIISVNQVDDGSCKSFSEYLLKASIRELAAVSDLLLNLERDGKVSCFPNVQRISSPHFRNPDFSKIREIRKKGLSI